MLLILANRKARDRAAAAAHSCSSAFALVLARGGRGRQRKAGSAEDEDARTAPFATVLASFPKHGGSLTWVFFSRPGRCSLSRFFVHEGEVHRVVLRILYRVCTTRAGVGWLYRGNLPSFTRARRSSCRSADLPGEGLQVLTCRVPLPARTLRWGSRHSAQAEISLLLDPFVRGQGLISCVWQLQARLPVQQHACNRATALRKRR